MKQSQYDNFIKWIAKEMTSSKFVGFFLGLVSFWVTFNIISPYKFDPEPFMALNLVMSALAGIQATVVAVQDRAKEVEMQKREKEIKLQDQKQREYIIHMMEALSELLKVEMNKHDKK